MYSVDQHQSIMSQCIHSPKPVVTRIDIDAITTQLGFVRKAVDECGRKIEMRDKVRCIRISQFEFYEYKHSFSEDEQWKRVVRCNNAVAVSPVIRMLPHVQVPVALAKFNDVKTAKVCARYLLWSLFIN